MSQDLARDRHMQAEPPLGRAYQALGDAGEVIKQLRAERDKLTGEAHRLATERDHARTRLDQSRAVARDLRQRLDAASAATIRLPRGGQWRPTYPEVHCGD